MTDGTTTWSYTYDANGMRTSRSNGTKTYNYVYNGSQLTQMTVGNDTLYFTYGVLGPTTVTWNGETYYYALNGQGDVEGIFDQNGNLVVFYYWENAWGYNSIPEGKLAGNSPLSLLGIRGHMQVHKTKKRPPLLHTKVAVNFDIGDFECNSSPVRDFDIFYALAVVICNKWKKGQKDRMGERIAHLRRSIGLSQSALAQALGLSTSTIAMYEQGRREPPVSIIIALAATLGVTIDYLLTGQPAQETFAQSPAIAACTNLVNTLLHGLL